MNFPQGEVMKVKVEHDKYSQSSKQSYGFEIKKRCEYYADIHYKCRNCGKAAIYPALEQKKAYESRKEHICSTRVLCADCWSDKQALKKSLATFEEKYASNKEAALSDREFLERWLAKLNSYNHYTHKPNSMRVQFLRKHLRKFT
ncbi:zinc-ribbon domain containing protein [Zooshikella ganghwensis]|uniref:Probable zinc-binding domain-containing protein n=1 Tax=Zooshikella ganghwensis TaxID=202772 RepID=A0A4V1IMU4_9GAMM|nr:zinc-ribbon domain containing protein [Zooshikella ganghwensis]RDH41441.1 hypothetical protein B9G39_28710 [Zooshikella ganghwensis]